AALPIFAQGQSHPVWCNVVQLHRIAAGGHHLSDARTHLPGADDGDCPDGSHELRIVYGPPVTCRRHLRSPFAPRKGGNGRRTPNPRSRGPGSTTTPPQLQPQPQPNDMISIGATVRLNNTLMNCNARSAMIGVMSMPPSGGTTLWIGPRIGRVTVSST